MDELKTFITPPPTKVSLLRDAIQKMKAIPAGDIPGLWIVEGYPELTSGQLIDVSLKKG